MWPVHGILPRPLTCTSVRHRVHPVVSRPSRHGDNRVEARWTEDRVPVIVSCLREARAVGACAESRSPRARVIGNPVDMPRREAQSRCLWHASISSNERSGVDLCRVPARSRAPPASTSIMRTSRDDRRLPMPAGPSCAGSSDASSDLQRSYRITRTTSCAYSLRARASGGAAVSNTDGRGFDTFRACSRAGQPVRPSAP